MKFHNITAVTLSVVPYPANVSWRCPWAPPADSFQGHDPCKQRAAALPIPTTERQSVKLKNTLRRSTLRRRWMLNRLPFVASCDWLTSFAVRLLITVRFPWCVDDGELSNWTTLSIHINLSDGKKVFSSTDFDVY